MKNAYTPKHLLAMLLLMACYYAESQTPSNYLFSRTGYDTVKHGLNEPYNDTLFVANTGTLTRNGSVDITQKGFYPLEYINTHNNITDTLRMIVHVTDSPGCYIVNRFATYFIHQIYTTFSVPPTQTNPIIRCIDTSIYTLSHNVNPNESGIYYIQHSITDTKGVTNRSRVAVYVVDIFSPKLNVKTTKGRNFPPGTNFSQMGIEIAVVCPSSGDSCWYEVDTTTLKPDQVGSYYIYFRAFKKNILRIIAGENAFALITISNTLSAKDESREMQFKLYPNPSQGIINLKTDVPITGINIYRADGREIPFTYNLTTQQIHIEERGLFYVAIHTPKDKLVRKCFNL